MKLEDITVKTKDLMLSGTILVTGGVLVGSFFSYLLQFFLGRMLTIQDYGTFNALLAVSYLVGVPASVFGTSITKISAELYAKNKINKLTTLFWELVSYAIVIGCSLFILVSTFKHSILEELHLNSLILVTYFGVYLGASYLNVVPSAYLQGLLKFKDLAIFNALSGFLRFLFPVILVFLGFNLVGVFAGIFISIAIVFYVAVQLLTKDFGILANIDLSSSYKKILSFSAPVLFVSSGLMLLNNLDILLVKKFFDETLVGYYAGVVTLGKILLFGTGTIATVMFPKISALYTRKEDYKSVFFKFFCLQIAVISAGVLAFVIFPDFFTIAFFGTRFVNSIIYLPSFSVFIGIYVIINFLVMYCLAIEKIRVFLFFIPAVIAQYLLIGYFHSTLMDVIGINVAISAALLFFISLYVVYVTLVQKR